MPTIYVLVGMIASGKSTYARGRADGGAIVVSHDAITEGIHARPRYEQEKGGTWSSTGPT
jgi:dephospho-CoA kinase